MTIRPISSRFRTRQRKSRFSCPRLRDDGPGPAAAYSRALHRSPEGPGYTQPPLPEAPPAPDPPAVIDAVREQPDAPALIDLEVVDLDLIDLGWADSDSAWKAPGGGPRAARRPGGWPPPAAPAEIGRAHV